MRVVGVVDVHKVTQTRFKIVGRGKITALEKPTGQHAQPQLDLIEPGPMRGRQVEAMLMGRIAQEGAALHAAPPSLRAGGHMTPWRDALADLKAPVRLEMIDHPIIALHRRELLDDVREMGGPLLTGARLAEMPHQLARRDDAGGQERAHPRADVLVLALFWLTRWHRLGGVRAW